MSDQANFRLLLVCTGNTCRSPMAQAIARRSVERRGWDGVEIRSAGVSAYRGGEASEGARVVAEWSELSLAEHMILTMGPRHADSAEALGGHGKVWMLTAFSDGGEDTRGPGVPDPVGGDAEDYLECFRALEGLVEAALGRVEADFLTPRKEAAQ